MQRSQNSWQIRQAVGLDNQNYYGGNRSNNFGLPQEFGTARMACLGWLNLLRAKRWQRRRVPETATGHWREIRKPARTARLVLLLGNDEQWQGHLRDFEKTVDAARRRRRASNRCISIRHCRVVESSRTRTANLKKRSLMTSRPTKTMGSTMHKLIRPRKGRDGTRHGLLQVDGRCDGHDELGSDVPSNCHRRITTMRPQAGGRQADEGCDRRRERACSDRIVA